MKQQLRKLKLYELGIAEWPYATSYEEMKEVVERNLEGCVIKTSDEYPGSYFFTQGKKVIMEQNQKNDVLWVSFEGYWSIFSKDFSLQYTDTQAIIKFLVEQHLISKVGTPRQEERPRWRWVEQHLISKVGTPLRNSV